MRSAVPKVLHPLCGRPIIVWPVAAARDAGAARVIVVDNPKRRLEEHLPEGVEVAIQEEPRGTGDAVAAAAPLIDPDATVVVINGDVALLTAEAIRRLVEAHEAAGAAATMATMEPDEPGAYGRVIRDTDGSVLRVVEAKGGAGRRHARGAPDPRGQHRRLRVRRRRAGGRARRARVRQRPGRALPARRAAGDARRRPHRGGAPDRRSRPHPRRRRPRRPRLRAAGGPAPHPRGAHARRRDDRRPGVAPASTPTVTIGRDTTIEPFAQLHGSTAIGSDTTIGAMSTLIDTQVGDGVTILHSHLTQARVDDGATVGPFAYLRPDAHLHPKAKAGTFVEIKNSEIGAGTQGAAPLLHRRRRRRRGHEHRGRQHHRQLRRAAQAPDDDRLRRQDQRRHRVRGARHGRRQRLHRRGQRHHGRRAARRARRSPAPARRTSRATRIARSGERAHAVHRSSYTPRLSERAGSQHRHRPPRLLARGRVRQAI